MKAEDIIAQIDKLFGEYEALKKVAKYDDMSDQRVEAPALAVRLRAAIERLTPISSAYAKEAAKLDDTASVFQINSYLGILRALRADILDGWLEGVTELLHADTFGNFLDQASELLNKGFKDASAVVAGTVLEYHIRLLCEKNSVDTEQSPGQPKKAETMNADLAKADAYNGLEQKSVTAWLGVRNAAAHGEYDKYDHKQVAGMITAVREFVIRYPA